MNVISHVLNAVLQVVVFACIPYAVFRLTHRDRGRSFRVEEGAV